MQSAVASNYKNIGLMTLILGVALLGFSVLNAHGQVPYYGNGGYYGQQNGRWNRVSQNDMRKAYDKGYKQGEKAGKNDAKNRRGIYNGNVGYRTSGIGQLQRAYQDGYNRGYQDGYDRNVRYNRNRRYGNYGNRSIFGIPLPY